MSYTKFQVCISMRSLIRSFCKIDMGGGGAGGGNGWIFPGFWVTLWCHMQNFRSLCQFVLSLEVFAKIGRWGGEGEGGSYNCVSQNSQMMDCQ